MEAAEISIRPPNPSFPTPYVYISNRNDPSPAGDSIGIFDVDSLDAVAEVRTGLKHVRGMTFGGVDDKWLVVGGTNGGGVKILERTEGGRGMRVVAGIESVVASTGFSWI